jgi:DNA-directed RNA polymerase specialized sigma24 family protein
MTNDEIEQHGRLARLGSDESRSKLLTVAYRYGASVALRYWNSRDRGAFGIEDIGSYAAESVNRALASWNPDRGLFSVYFFLAAKRGALAGLKSSTTIKNTTNVNIENPVISGVLGTREGDPLAAVIARDDMDEMMERFRLLAGLERECYVAWLRDEPYDEIAERIGKSNKSVDNAIQRAKKRMGTSWS